MAGSSSVSRSVADLHWDGLVVEVSSPVPDGRSLPSAARWRTRDPRRRLARVNAAAGRATPAPAKCPTCRRPSRWNFYSVHEDELLCKSWLATTMDSVDETKTSDFLAKIHQVYNEHPHTIHSMRTGDSLRHR